MTLYKVYFLLAEVGEGVEKSGGVEQTGYGEDGKVTQANCHMTQRVCREDAICHHLARCGHQGTEWAIVLDFGGRSWQLTQKFVSPRTDRQSLSRDSGDISLTSRNVEMGEVRMAQERRRRRKIRKRNTESLSLPIQLSLRLILLTNGIGNLHFLLK